jgi:hypothetical protein
VQIRGLKGQQEPKELKVLRELKVQVQELKGQQETKEPKVPKELNQIL